MARKYKGVARKPAKQNQYIILILYAALILSIAGYIFSGNVLIGIFAFFVLVVTLAMEFKYSVKEEGLKKSIYDIFAAIAIIAVLWIILIAALGTYEPVDVVASCSMLPTMQRGDLVLLHGIPNMTSFLKDNHIPVVNVSAATMNATLQNMDSEFLAYFAHAVGNNSDIGESFATGGLPIGLYNTKCIDELEAQGLFGRIGTCEVQSQKGNLIKYYYSVQNESVGGNMEQIAQTSSIAINGTMINENYSNPIIVYRTTGNDSFSGDIIHRVVAAIHAGSNYYILTKGDNNGGLDIQFVNYPETSSQVVGYVVGSVPYLGYLKLIVSGMFATPAGCNSTILR